MRKIIIFFMLIGCNFGYAEVNDTASLSNMQSLFGSFNAALKPIKPVNPESAGDLLEAIRRGKELKKPLPKEAVQKKLLATAVDQLKLQIKPDLNFSFLTPIAKAQEEEIKKKANERIEIEKKSLVNEFKIDPTFKEAQDSLASFLKHRLTIMDKLLPSPEERRVYESAIEKRISASPLTLNTKSLEDGIKIKAFNGIKVSLLALVNKKTELENLQKIAPRQITKEKVDSEIALLNQIFALYIKAMADIRTIYRGKKEVEQQIEIEKIIALMKEAINSLAQIRVRVLMPSIILERRDLIDKKLLAVLKEYALSKFSIENEQLYSLLFRGFIAVASKMNAKSLIDQHAAIKKLREIHIRPLAKLASAFENNEYVKDLTSLLQKGAMSDRGQMRAEELFALEELTQKFLQDEMFKVEKEFIKALGDSQAIPKDFADAWQSSVHDWVGAVTRGYDPNSRKAQLLKLLPEKSGTEILTKLSDIIPVIEGKEEEDDRDPDEWL